MVTLTRAHEAIKRPDGQIDPRIVRTRQLLQQSFTALMTEKGFQNLTVQDVTDRAGVNRATFYAHFEDKYALLNYTVRESLEAMLQKRLPDKAAFTINNLRLLTVTTHEFIDYLFGHCHPFSPNNEHMLIAYQVQLHLNDIIHTWLIGDDSQKARAAAQPDPAPVLSWTIFGAVLEWMRGDRKEPPEQSADRVLTFLLPSLAPFLTGNGAV